MSYPVFAVPAGDVLPVMFSTYAGATGASATLSGLAVTDIEIYKDGSTTQRASDAGYTLLDTDGIDFDGITGIHGFSIDTGDNTDAGFYTVGAWFTVVVSAVTIDSQTVNFIACQFRIVAAESVAGTPKADVSALGGDAQSATDLKDFADAGYDPSTNKVQGVVLVDALTTYTGNTPQTGDAFARLGAPAGASHAADIAAVKAETATIVADTNELQTDWVNGGRLDLLIDAIKAKTDNLPTDPADASDISALFSALQSYGDTNWATATGFSTLDAAGIRSALGMSTSNLPKEAADALLGRNIAGGSDGGRTVQEALYFLRNKWTNIGGTLTVYATDDTTSAWTASLTQGPGDPVSAVDPA